VLGERSGVLEAPALGVAAGVFDPAMLPLSNEALIPLVGVHRGTHSRGRTHTHTHEKEEQWTQGFLRCVLVATFSDYLSSYLFDYRGVAGRDPTCAP
jgi:hypothetical protein